MSNYGQFLEYVINFAVRKLNNVDLFLESIHRMTSKSYSISIHNYKVHNIKYNIKYSMIVLLQDKSYKFATMILG